MDGTRPPRSPGNPAEAVKRRIYAAAGLVMLGIGFVGVFVPGLPTTIFLLAAAWLFARSSPRLHRWLVSHPKLGPYIRLAQTRRMTRRSKATSMVLMWIAIGLSAWLLTSVSWMVRMLLIVLGLIGSWFILFWMRTHELSDGLGNPPSKSSRSQARARFQSR